MSEGKYLKYKQKYQQLKLNQKGGEKHNNAIRKDGPAITFPNGFPNLQTNGNYNIVHEYDASEFRKRQIIENVELLQLWVTATFNYGDDVPPGDDGINKAYAIYNSVRRDDLIALVNWLLNNRG